MATWASRDGWPAPLGATWVPSEQAYNFAIYSKHATAVTLLLYRRDDLVTPVATLAFDPLANKTGRVWHARVPRSHLNGAHYYAYSIDGPPPSGNLFEQHAFSPAKILLDPYARAVFIPPSYSRASATGAGGNAGQALLGILCGEERAFDWDGDRRPRHDHDLVIYEMHVRGFTQSPDSGVSPANRGTFAGVIERIPYLLDLGVTAVELMPVFHFDETEPNYWGYMPLSFFAPHPRYSTAEGTGVIREFQQMVKALHRAGIEVLVDVVYNHTGEGHEGGQVVSFKGIDNSTYYLAWNRPDESSRYANYSGAGNTLHCANRAVRQLIADSLRYWASEMHLDGFRFDLASIFSRDRDGNINYDDPPIFGDIETDPALCDVRMIAEPWEGNFKYPNYQLGNSPLQRSFPGIGWRQWNDRFRETVRNFVRGGEGTTGDLATRLHGSSDLFPDSDGNRAYQSLNYVASHDGLTLYDLVAYNTADSWNCGQEGDTGVSAAVMRLRKQQAKNFFAILLLANGTPMFRAGDEFLQTQSGDGNPYAEDSPKTWLDWERLREHADVHRFAKKMIALRKEHPSLCRSRFWRDDIRWHGVGPAPDWSPDSHSLAFCLHGVAENDRDIYVMLNAFREPLSFRVQEGTADEWARILDTSLDSPDDFPDSPAKLESPDYQVQPRSCVVLLRS